MNEVLSPFFAAFIIAYLLEPITRKLSSYGISRTLASLISILVGTIILSGIISLLFSYYIDIWSPSPVPNTMIPTFLQLVILLTIISNIICYNLYGYLLKRYTATILSFFGLLSPIFASFHGYFILGESMSPLIFLSTGIVLIGLKLVYSEEIRLGYIKRYSAKDSSA